MVESDEQVSVRVAEIAAQVEALHSLGTLSTADADAAYRALFRARDIDQVQQVASPIQSHGVMTVPLLEVADVHAELVGVDCDLQRIYLNDYAGYRISADNRFVEFGFRDQLGERLGAIRKRVSFPARVAGFRARYALVELRHAWVMVYRAADELDALGIDVKAADVCVGENVVVVGVASDVAEAARLLQHRFGSMVSARQDLGYAT
jgi:hypothetical protein